jgi:hypothetical protein
LFIISLSLPHLFTVLKENRPKGVNQGLFILPNFLSILGRYNDKKTQTLAVARECKTMFYFAGSKSAENGPYGF